MTQPQWHVLSMLPVIAALSDEQLANANEQYATLQQARDRPHLLTDEIVTRVIRLYAAQRDELPLAREQLMHWRTQTLSREQAREI